MAAVVILLSAGGCGEAYSYYCYGRGMQCYAKEDYKRAFKYLKASADHGDGRGQYAVAELFLYGEGTEKSLAESVKYYELAIANKNTPDDFRIDAEGKLGYLYLTEESVRNSRRGEKYLTEAAEPDENVYYQVSLGMCFYKGIGVERDCEKAFKWLSKAAGADIAPDADKAKQKIYCRAKAEYYLGEMYLKGEGAPKDVKKAFRSFEKGAEDGNPDAECMLGYMYVAGEGAAKDRSRGMEMLRKQAAADNPKAKEVLEHIKKNNL